MCHPPCQRGRTRGVRGLLRSSLVRLERSFPQVRADFGLFLLGRDYPSFWARLTQSRGCARSFCVAGGFRAAVVGWPLLVVRWWVVGWVVPLGRWWGVPGRCVRVARGVDSGLLQLGPNMSASEVGYDPFFCHVEGWPRRGLT